MATDLDRIDRHILAVLQSEGRLPNQAVADRVGLSPSACLRRVRALEEAGVITGYVALVDPARLGYGRTVFVEVTLDSQRQEALEAFEHAVRSCPGLVACHLMSGEADYLLTLSVAGLEGYDRLHRDHLARLPGVARMRSSFAIRTVVARTTPEAPAPA